MLYNKGDLLHKLVRSRYLLFNVRYSQRRAKLLVVEAASPRIRKRPVQQAIHLSCLGSECA